MIDALTASSEVLSSAGFSTGLTSIAGRQALIFEDDTVLGFLFAYDCPSMLIERWSRDGDAAIAKHQFGLRHAATKAWNTYVVLLATSEADFVQSVALAAIEEDLVGTRKICRAGIVDVAEIRAALLPLLPFQTAPRLEAVDIVSEIRQRTTELPRRVVDAFLSDANESVVMQVLEERS